MAAINPECRLYTEEFSVKSRLADFRLTLDQVKRVPLAALGARNTSVSFDPRTAAGTFAYHFGVRALREVCLTLTTGYEMVSRNNIESVYDPAAGRKIMFQSCDVACQAERWPQCSSPMGPGKEEVVTSATGFLFDEMAQDESLRLQQLGEYDRAEAWYIFVAINGDGAVSCELSRPHSVLDKQFYGFYERIFLIDGVGPSLDLDDDSPDLDIKPSIQRV